MSKSYRFRTKVGVDREVRLNIEQDFDFLEILSLKLRQEDLYERFCADYGVVTGRVIANGGFGVPNVNISIFVPLDDIDQMIILYLLFTLIKIYRQKMKMGIDIIFYHT